MYNDIRLFINDSEIEFKEDPKILFNYKETELHNPTVVRNSFSKQITIEGTPSNNKVFGHIWDLTRIQGDNFNPIQKTDFQLFLNGELYQKGYVKLDKVTRTNNTTSYQITLFGNLGTFFYNLTYDQDDASSTKKTLASLKYSMWDQSDPNLEFTIDKDSVAEAWGQIAGGGSVYDDKWNVINFVPALNGIPSDFDAGKVLINNNGLNQGGDSGFISFINCGGTGYYPVLNGTPNPNGYSLGEISEDLQEWQTRDLRSWCQRPCVSMYRIIQACCQPENNGGFEVDLDSHFFHLDNPYYRDAWVTMPLLRDLEGMGAGQTYPISGATISTASTGIYGPDMFPVQFSSEGLASVNNINMTVSVRFEPDEQILVRNLYPYHTYHSKTTATLQGSTFVKDLEENQGVILQMIAIGSLGEVVGQSKAYLLGGQKNFHKKNNLPMWYKFWRSGNVDYGTEPEYEFLEGYFKQELGHYVFCNMRGENVYLNFSFAAPSDFVTLMMKIKTPKGEYCKYAFMGEKWWNTESEGAYNTVSMYTSQKYSTTGNHRLDYARSQDRVLGHYAFVVEDMEGVANDYEGMFSGTKITKERLLTTEYTPADYLLSYCKMFGLYFYYDSTEESSDTDKFPSGVVHIMDRDSFYTDEVVDLSELVDWNKTIEITPALANTKWYRFDTEHVESELEAGYKAQYGKDYGAQVVNTNYNFDSQITDLYDGNAFKSAIMCLEKDKYYKKTSLGLPVYQYNGLTYNLFHRADSTSEFETFEIEFPFSTTLNMISVNPDYEFYDAFPKLQFHGENNEAVEGENVLVFFKGGTDVYTDYWLTDDVPDMAILNDGQPCWILTRSEYDGAGNQIAVRVNRFPVFSRDLILFGRKYGNIVHSWNFGHPQVIYSPDTYTTDGDAIYDVCWRDYIRDLYDVDTRKLSCYVRAVMDDRPWPYWLRRFYWFENSIWRLNEIKDFDPSSFDTTKMEFIKVQDMDNYKLDKIKYIGRNEIVVDQSEIGCAATTVTGHVFLQGGGSWVAGEYIGGVDGHGIGHILETQDVMTPYSGRGEYTEFEIEIPGNSGDTPITWEVKFEDDFDEWYGTTFIQDTCSTASTLTVTPSASTVSSRSGSTALTINAIRVSGITASVNVNWATISLSGNEITVQFDANQTTSSRTATITVNGTGTEGAISATAAVTQNGLGTIEVSPQTVYLDYMYTDRKTFNITTDDNWTSNITDN